MPPPREHIALDLHKGYRPRLLGGCIAALLLLIGIAHIPAPVPRSGIDWHTRTNRHVTHEEILTLTRAQVAGPLTPAGAFGGVAPDGQGNKGKQAFDLQAVSDSLPDAGASRRPEIPRLKRFQSDYADIEPQVVGGMGAFYINIEYPREAQLAGIEGQLILSFIIEKDGAPSDIRVLQSLHPLCDSAAVRALRLTRFVPVRENGKYIRLRMRLPVRFKLLDTPHTP